MKNKLILPENCYREIKYDFVPASYFIRDSSDSFMVDEKRAPKINLVNGKMNGVTDLFVDPDYKGRFIGSSRHLSIDRYTIKGAGLGLLEHAKFNDHSSGLLLKKEAFREYLLAYHLSDCPAVVNYYGLGKYLDGEYFIVRDSLIPRLSQININDLSTDNKVDLKKVLLNTADNNLINIATNAVVNLFSPFNFNLTHDSVNVHNINLFGQYLDLNSFLNLRNSVVVSFWNNLSFELDDGHLKRIEDILRKIFLIYTYLFESEFIYEDVISSALLSSKLSPNSKFLLKSLLENGSVAKIKFLRSKGTIQENGDSLLLSLPSNFDQNIDLSYHLYEIDMNGEDDQFSKFLKQIKRVKISDD